MHLGVVRLCSAGSSAAVPKKKLMVQWQKSREGHMVAFPLMHDQAPPPPPHTHTRPFRALASCGDSPSCRDDI